MQQEREILYLFGLPGSGKSTLANDWMKKHKNFFRINKDDIRRTILGDTPWSYKKEKVVLEAEEAIAKSLVALNKSIIVDNTNLNPKHLQKWQQFAKDHGYKFSQLSLLATPIEECIRRDAWRPEHKRVGRDVILNMATQYGLRTQEKPCIYCDLDGSLCDISIRREYATMPNGKINWDIFFNPDLICLDKRRKDVMQMVYDEKIQGVDVIIVSGRSEVTRKATEEWLTHHGLDIFGKEVWWNRLIMRPASDSRPDDELKEWFLDNYLEGGKNCIKIFDDRARVIRMWERRGLSVVNVAIGDNEF